MDKTIVVYWSKSGFAQRYAKMIADKTGADIANGRRLRRSALAQYDTIVFGGGMYAVGIYGAKYIRRCIDTLSDKRIIVFAQGASPPRPEVTREVLDKNFSAEQQARIQFFLLRGGFDFDKLTPIGKIMMRLLKVKLKRKKAPTADERGMLAAYDTPADFVSEKLVMPVIEAIEA